MLRIRTAVVLAIALGEFDSARRDTAVPFHTTQNCYQRPRIPSFPDHDQRPIARTRSAKFRAPVNISKVSYRALKGSGEGELSSRKSYHSESNKDVVSLDESHDIPSCKDSRDHSHDHQYQKRIDSDADISSMITVCNDEERWQHTCSRHGGQRFF